MEGKKNFLKNKDVLAVLFLVIIFSVGIAGHLISSLKPLMTGLTPWTLLICGGVVFYSVIRSDSPNFILWFFTTYVVTFIIEAAGVNTGMIFGEYSYGEVLGPGIFGTPLIIGLNWVFVLTGLIILSEKLFYKTSLLVIFSAALAVVFDYFMEPVAVKLAYWIWLGGDIPFQNYAAWYFTALIAAVLFRIFKVKVNSFVPVYYVAIQFIFFLILSVGL